MAVIVFDQPWVLSGFAAFIPLILAYRFSVRRKRIRKRLSGQLRKKLFASQVLFWLSLACLILTLAGPRWGIGQTAGEYRGALDVVIAIDVSRSMEIKDSQHTGSGSRLERGMAIVRKTVTDLPGLRFAAAVSRDRGILAVPLTWDNGAVLAFLDAIDGSTLTGRGTNLESLIDSAAGAFQISHPSSRVILLVSDGEALSGSLRAAIGRCNRDGIIVTAIAVGSDEGRLLPGSDDIISRRDTGALRMAAGETGGAFIDGNRDDAAEALFSHLRSHVLEIKTGGSKTERKARWFIFALLAILFFGASKASLLKLRNGGSEITNAATN